MQISTLEQLFVDELKDLYSAENQILKALPKMAQMASHPDLQDAFQEHLQQTREHVARLDQIFGRLGKDPSGKTCKGMQGLLAEGEEMIAQISDPQARDAAMISAAQRVEHYEMAGYGTVRTYARELDLGADADLLQKTLDEEGATDHKLTKLAERGINKDAMPTSRAA